MNAKAARGGSHGGFPCGRITTEKGDHMIPTLAIREKMAQLLAADTATLAPSSSPPVVALVMAQFNPSEYLTAGDLTLATFDGSAPIPCQTGPQNEALDPATNDAIIDMVPPVGGWRWETTGTANLPQTIYGFALLKGDLSTVYGAALLPAPVTLSGVNQRLELDAVNFTQRANSVS